MKSANDYLDRIKAIIISESCIEDIFILREEIQGKIGFYRYRIIFEDGFLLEMFERFDVINFEINILKYSFHWQNSDSILLKRWDNAAHHPEISSYPHHIHEGSEDNVLPYMPVTATDILNTIILSFKIKKE